MTTWDEPTAELSKWDVVAALKRSGLPPSDRIIIMMLVDVADAETAFVPEQWTPSLTELAKWTGLGRSTVAARLKVLEGLGWVKRARPATADAIVRGERTCYQLAIGQSVEKARPSRPANPTRTAPSPTAGLVRETDQVTTGSPSTELVQPLDQASPTAGLPLVQPLDRPSPAAGHKNHPPTEGGSTHQDLPEPTSPPSPPPAIDADGALFDETGRTNGTGSSAKKTTAKRKKASTTSTAPAIEDFPITDAMRAWAASKAPDVTDLEFHTEQFLTHHAAKGTKFKSWPTAWQTWVRNEQKWRGGGSPGARAAGRPRRTSGYQNPADTAAYYADEE